MKIVADENIPFIKDYFGSCGELILKPGRQISSKEVKEADFLIVRSITPINANLLSHSKVKYVGSVTTGTDHIDIPWLEEQGIEWTAAPGCNAQAVVEYIFCLVMALKNKLPPSRVRAAVIGVGKIGSRVSRCFEMLGFEVVLIDPPRALSDASFQSGDMSALREVDLITLHTPLVTTGLYPTYHLINEKIMTAQKPGTILINTSRGSVVDFKALKTHGQHLQWCLDVWENEPLIDASVLAAACIASPHIAGYTLQAKERGTRMIYEAACRRKWLSPGLPGSMKVSGSHSKQLLGQSLDQALLNMIDLLKTTKRMKETLLQDPLLFDDLRLQFAERNELSAYNLEKSDLPLRDKKWLEEISGLWV